MSRSERLKENVVYPLLASDHHHRRHLWCTCHRRCPGRSLHLLDHVPYSSRVIRIKKILKVVSPQVRVDRQRDTKRKNPLSMSLSAHYLNKADPRVLHTCTRFRYATISCQRRFYVASVADVHTPISCS